MPMTLSHPAAVVPLRWLGLPTSAMVIGSMVPDIPLFLGSSGYLTTHGFVGVVTVDVAAALLLLACWNGWVRDALVDLAPDAVRSRLAVRSPLTGRQWLLAPVAAAVGALSHVLWDAFTHRRRWGVEAWDWLRTDLGPLPAYKWAQYVSGVVGLVVVVAATVAYVRSRDDRRTDPARLLPAPTLPLVLAAAAAYGGAVGVAHVDDGWHAIAYEATVAGIIALVVVTAATSLLWVALRARSHAP